MVKCPKCGYEMEAANLPCCVSCHVANLDQQEADSAANVLDEAAEVTPIMWANLTYTGK